MATKRPRPRDPIGAPSLTLDEARWVAAIIAKLPKLLRRAQDHRDVRCLTRLESLSN
jgi:hypothetical protein